MLKLPLTNSKEVECMATKKSFYNLETERVSEYTEKFILSDVQVGNVTGLKVMHHYWQDSDGELWGDFDDPMENVLADFAAYRKHLHFLTPEEISKIIKSLNIDLRSLANFLGISASTISSIATNNRVQDKYQDNLFKSLRERIQLDGVTATKKYIDDVNDQQVDINMNGSEIKNLRHKFNLTVREFAKQLGIGSSQLSQVENNLREPTTYQKTLFCWKQWQLAHDSHSRNQEISD